jgi:hypothetical protein
MPSPELRAPLDVIRREAELARDAASLRSVATEAGMTAMGLRAFINGVGKPQERTVRKLNLWYARRMATRVPQGGDEARSALIVLAGFYPQADRARVVGGLLDVMEKGFRDGGMELPAWLAALRAELRESGG